MLLVARSRFTALGCVIRRRAAATKAVGAQELESYPSQPRPQGQDRFEPLCCAPWHAKAQFDFAEQPEPLYLILLAGRPRLLKERPGTV